VNKIPPFDLSEQFKLIGDSINAAVLEVLASGRYIGGATVETFEQQFASYIGSSSCIACNSGTDALYLALRAVGIGAGDEVITTPFTFVATAEVISAVGATPVFIDIEADSFNLDLQQLEAAITSRTKAIIPVHLFGRPVDMTRLMTIAQAHNLLVIEDCAQSTGAEWAGQKVGSIGQIGCFSFYPTKNLGACGDGGAITTNDAAIAERLHRLRDHGRRGAYYYEELGVNSRLDAVQAAILQIKLRHLETWNQQRHAVAQHYQQLLSPISDIILPQSIANGKSVWNQYTIRLTQTTPNVSDPPYRDAVQSKLRDRGVISMVYYPLSLHLQPAYKMLGYQPGQLPISEQASQQVLSLPMFPELQPTQQAQVAYMLKDCLSAE
jgi:dTDP-4-amino-4,6-dideoxygalactose transaminase